MHIHQDSDDTGKYTGITINVNNSSGGQKVQINLGVNDPATSQVAWSSGRSFATAAGMQLTSSTGSLPLQQLNVTGTSITFLTASGGGGGTISFTFQLYLVGSPDLRSFWLTAMTDPNVLVTAATTGSLPQTVGTGTILNWPS